MDMLGNRTPHAFIRLQINICEEVANGLVGRREAWRRQHHSSQSF
jgi:hypothetical protein